MAASAEWSIWKQTEQLLWHIGKVLSPCALLSLSEAIFEYAC